MCMKPQYLLIHPKILFPSLELPQSQDQELLKYRYGNSEPYLYGTYNMQLGASFVL